MDAEYLQRTVGKCLAIGLAEVSSVRPADPIEYLALWLLKQRTNLEARQASVSYNHKQELTERECAEPPVSVPRASTDAIGSLNPAQAPPDPSVSADSTDQAKALSPVPRDPIASESPSGQSAERLETVPEADSDSELEAAAALEGKQRAAGAAEDTTAAKEEHNIDPKSESEGQEDTEQEDGGQEDGGQEDGGQEDRGREEAAAEEDVMQDNEVATEEESN